MTSDTSDDADETLDGDDDGDDGEDADMDGMLIGYVLGPPSAFSSECVLLEYDRKKPGSGCCAVVRCECAQPFRMDLLKQEPTACPKCKKEYTSLLLVCPVDDDVMLQSVFAHLVNVQEGEHEHNPAGDDDSAIDEPVTEPEE